jgi:GNAT superfamily N-acetyltransferase
MARYLAEAFGVERQRAEIADPGAIVLLAEGDDGARGELAGYAHLVETAPPDVVRGPAPIELKRFYVARALHGQGVARLLMDAVLDAARERGAGTVWLGVWERNPRAIAFYEKCGYARVGEQRFVLGADVQTDWVMARSVAAPGNRPGADAPRRR